MNPKNANQGRRKGSLPGLSGDLEKRRSEKEQIARKGRIIALSDRRAQAGGKPPFYNADLSLEEYNRLLNYGVSNPAPLTEMVRKHGKANNRRVRVLDVGCGHGIAMRKLKESLESVSGLKVETHGLTFTKPLPGRKNHAGENIDHVHYGFIENYGFKEKGVKFDVIVSMNGFMHFVNPGLALQNIVNSLAVRGEALLDIRGVGSHEGLSEMLSSMKQQGIIEVVNPFRLPLSDLVKVLHLRKVGGKDFKLTEQQARALYEGGIILGNSLSKTF